MAQVYLIVWVVQVVALFILVPLKNRHELAWNLVEIGIPEYTEVRKP